MRLKTRLLLLLAKHHKGNTKNSFCDLNIEKLPRFDRILVLSTTAIGDTLLSTPVLTALHEEYPDATIKFLVRDKFSTLFVNNSEIDGIILYHKSYLGLLKTYRQIKNGDFQLALVLHISDPQPAALAKLAGIPCIIGNSPGKNFNHLFTKTAKHKPGVIHGIDYRMDVIKTILPRRRKWPYRMILPLNNDKTRLIFEEFCQKMHINPVEQIVIGFQPGASEKFRMWPRDNFIALGKALLELNKQIKILILGSLNEKKLAKTIEEGIGQKESVFFHFIPLSDLPHIVSRLQCLVTNDTGTMHIAVAVQTPTVALFVPTDPLGIGPVQDMKIHRVVAKPSPCGNDCKGKRCPENIECMSLISVKEVLEAVSSVLKL